MSAGNAAPRPAPGRHDLAITAGALMLLLAWEFSGWDLALAARWGGPAGFAWRDAWLTRDLLHSGGRVAAWWVLGVLLLGVWRPGALGPSRRERLAWLGVTLACLLLIPLLKRYSSTSCPWDLAMFGGVAAYVPHWRLQRSLRSTLLRRP